jgi:four helix bundle protein
MQGDGDNIIAQKSYHFALEIIKVTRYLRDELREYDIARQLLRSGTSIGANVEEAIGGYTDKDFSAKFSIVYKEARETHFWIRLLRDSEILDHSVCERLLKECEELIKISGSIVRTMKKKLR